MSFGKKLRHTLLQCGQVISEEHDTTLMLIGRRCADDTRFFARMKGDEGVTLRKAEEALAWLSYHWPADREWPATFFERPDAEFVRKVMKRLPKDRRDILGKRALRKLKATISISPPIPDASRAAKPAPAPTGLGAGELSTQQEHQG